MGLKESEFHFGTPLSGLIFGYSFLFCYLYCTETITQILPMKSFYPQHSFSCQLPPVQAYQIVNFHTGTSPQISLSGLSHNFVKNFVLESEVLFFSHLP